MSGMPFPPAAEQEARSQEIPRWLRLLQDWKALAWPAVAAFLAALFLICGSAAERGKTAALGIYHLNKPSISQEYVIAGAVTLAALGLQVVIIVIVATGLRALARRVVRRLPGGLQARLGAIPKRVGWGWVVVIAAVAISGLGGSIAGGLMRDADAMILKPAKEVGTPWMRMSLDQDQDWEMGYHLLLATTITIFAFLSWWILTRFATSRTGRVLYGTWATIQMFFLLIVYAFIFGAGATFQPYPIVAFSNMEPLCGKGAIPVLIGSDDKVYAFLLVFNVGAPNDKPSPSKAILYLPRTEVKWLMVLRQMPLHIIAHYHDLKGLLPPAQTNPEPAPDASGPGTPTRNSPSATPQKPTPPR